mgnify:FL=1
MLESMFNPRRLEKGPWKMFFIGILYASLSLFLVKWFFARDAVLSQYSGLLVVTFCVMFTIPFMYFIIREEEAEDEEVFGLLSVWKIHKDAIYSFLWLFFGFIIAFSFWYIIIQDSTLFNAQF